MLLLAGGLPAWAQDDPPGRVGRLNYVQGGVSFSPAGSDEWVEARTSRPITSGDRVWMGRDARSELSIGSAVLRSDEDTSLKVLQLDDDQAQFQLSEGTVAIHVRSMDPDDRLEIATPSLAFVVDRPGDYRIRVDPDDNVTTITVEHGQGTAYADDGQHRLNAPSHARFVAGGLEHVSADLPRRDDFDRWVDTRIERVENRQASRYVSRDMVGYEDLDDYGSWSQEPDYGWVWAPRVTTTAWAPYRHGHWSWIAPWGWTWVDDAPWGFAPFHYGRWAHVRNRWCWVPGPVVRRPYYAPALVAFVGTPGASVTISSGPAVTWFPLGPREEYRPVYRASPTYITRINQVVVVEQKHGGHRHPHGEYANRHIPGAFTALPARAFVEGRPVDRERIRVGARELQQSPILGTMPALAPVRTSLVGDTRRAEAPPRRQREREAVTTRMPAPPPVERDELARRFAQTGNRVREAGPTLAEQPPRRAENREDRALRVLAPGALGVGNEERRPPAAAEEQQGERRGPPGQEQARERQPDRDPRNVRPQDLAPGLATTVEQRRREANRPPEGQRAAPDSRREREQIPRGFGLQEQQGAPEPSEQPRFQMDRREANRPPEGQRGAPESRREREHGPRGIQESPRPPETSEQPQRPQFERREASRPPEAQQQRPENRRDRDQGVPRGFGLNQDAPDGVPVQRQRPDRSDDSPRQRERQEVQRPQDRPSPAMQRFEERRPREVQQVPQVREPPQMQQREVRAQPQAPAQQERRQEGGREHKEQQQRERMEQIGRRFSQPE